jgi:hypothetical protein
MCAIKAPIMRTVLRNRQPPCTSKPESVKATPLRLCCGQPVLVTRVVRAQQFLVDFSGIPAGWHW